MSRIYRKPPLVEALCEFQFAQGEWDFTVPGLLYEKLGKQFPQKRQTPPDLQLQSEVDEGQAGQRLNLRPGRMQFVREDESALVQLAPHLLVINHLLPYPHWGGFRTLVLNSLDAYRSVANPGAIKRIGLRYINRIRLPSEAGGQLEHYFNISPRMPAEIAGALDGLLMRIERRHASEQGRLLLTLGTTPDDEPTVVAYLLDLDFVTLPDANVAFDEVEVWIEAAHTHIERAFEACVTQQLRDQFEEIL